METVLDQTNQPSPDDVIRHVDMILDSRFFRDDPNLRKLLQYCVEMRLADRTDRLHHDEIARHVFDRDATDTEAVGKLLRAMKVQLDRALRLFRIEQGTKSGVSIELPPGQWLPVLTTSAPAHARCPIEDMLQVAYLNQTILSADTRRWALIDIENGLQAHPENPDLLATYAELQADCYVLDPDASRAVLDTAWDPIEAARRVAPLNPRVIFVDGYLRLLLKDAKGGHDCGQLLQRHAGGQPHFESLGKWLEMLTAPTSSAHEASLCAGETDGDGPGWLRHPRFLAAYHQQDYERALSEAFAFGMPNLVYAVLDRAAAMAQLGLAQSARKELNLAVKLNPRLLHDARSVASMFIFDDDMVEHFMDGIYRAGLNKI